ncbi:MAG TPA: hypothetical protein PLU53_06500 [Bacteroidia bacterium]|nr:hypothetical protein [Bacteroidia bacterium]
MSFYIAIILFISSVVIALVLMIMGKNLGTGRFFLLAGLHSILLFGFIASLLLRASETGVSAFNYFFLIYFCSGVVLCGWVWRIQIPKIIRIYFALFTLGFPMFLFSPSMMVNFLLTTRYTDSFGPSFSIHGNIWLETQSSVTTQDSVPTYKLVRKRGLYRETLARDITFSGKVDSVKLLDLQPGKIISIRGYSHAETFVSTDIDSTDREISLVSKKRNGIEYRL